MEQNQSSAPRLRPPNTLCNTDGWRRTRKSTSKITVRSAKKQERLKKHGTQNQSATGFDLETPSVPSFLTQDVTHSNRPLCLPGLSHLLTFLTRLTPLPRRSEAPQASRWPSDLLGGGDQVRSAQGWLQRSQRGSCECAVSCGFYFPRVTWTQTRRLGYYHGSSVIVCGSVPLQFYSQPTWKSNHL